MYKNWMFLHNKFATNNCIKFYVFPSNKNMWFSVIHCERYLSVCFFFFYAGNAFCRIHSVGELKRGVWGTLDESVYQPNPEAAYFGSWEELQERLTIEVRPEVTRVTHGQQDGRLHSPLYTVRVRTPTRFRRHSPVAPISGRLQRPHLPQNYP